MRAACLRAVEALAPTQSFHLLALRGVPLDVRGSRVSGWRSLVGASWISLWSAIRLDGFLTNDWSQDEHELVEAVHFFLFYALALRSRARRPGHGVACGEGRRQ